MSQPAPVGAVDDLSHPMPARNSLHDIIKSEGLRRTPVLGRTPEQDRELPNRKPA